MDIINKINQINKGMYKLIWQYLNKYFFII